MQAKKYLLFLISFLGIGVLFFIGPIPQDVCYHNFSDNRILFGYPNFLNVISNTPFIIVGVFGMLYLLNQKIKKTTFPLFLNCVVFFFGIFLTGLGSWYYHYKPTNSTLLWDRLPMTISFMAFFSIIIGDCINNNGGRKMLFPLICVGILSIVYWQTTAYFGCCDLRFYALVQFLPIVIIPFILLTHKSQFGIKPFYWLMLLAYVFAKFFEASDVFIFNYTHIVSGHTIKHIAASIAPILFLTAIKRKRALETKL